MTFIANFDGATSLTGNGHTGKDVPLGEGGFDVPVDPTPCKLASLITGGTEDTKVSYLDGQSVDDGNLSPTFGGSAGKARRNDTRAELGSR